MSDPRFRWLARGRVLISVFLGVLFGLLVLRWAAGLYVDHLWYQAQGATRVFWTRTLWDWGARFATGVVAAGVVGLNLRPVARAFAGLKLRRRFGDLVIQERLPTTYLRWGVIAVASLAGLWFAAALPSGTGLQILLGIHGPETGTADPVLGADTGFYLFRLPLLTGILTWGMVLVVFSAALASAGYAGSAGLRFGPGKVDADPEVASHLALLLSILLLLVSLRLLLSPYLLLSSGTSAVQGIVGATDLQARIPGLRLVAFLTFVTAAATAWGALRSRILPGLAGTGALVLLSLGILQLYPAFVQRFQVQPNELVRETPNIERAIAATRFGFGLHDLERERLAYRAPDPEDLADAEARLTRIPLWTDKTLLETFQEVEARFDYYGFAGITFDRYPDPRDPDASVPVALSVREVDQAGIAPEAQTWQNLHLRERYVTGLGAVAGPAHRQSPEGRMPTWLGAVPPDFRDGPEVPPALRLERPQVHVGSVRQPWSVVTPAPDAFQAPDGSPGTPGIDFPEGIRVGSILRRGALAWHFQDANLLISGEISPESRVVHRRDAVSRVQALAPYLHTPEAPYAVVSEGRVVWILEAFTLSRRYPLAVAHAIGGGTRGQANYARNSAKATVDAVTGETRIYASDPSDPLLQAWRGAFPGLILDMEAFPAGLRDHLRYPRWLMDLQIQVLLRYHQENPAVFHGQQEPWAVAMETPDAQGSVPYLPSYAPLRLPGDATESWALSTVLIPAGRQNLASFLAGTWTPESGGRLRLWDVPQEDQVAGPRQVSALVEQDPVISEQFSLWRRGGSDVSTGHLQLVPVGGTLLYLEPVFLAAESNAIPELRRYIVSDGRRVAMEPTLDGAIQQLRLGFGAGDAEVAADPATLDPDAGPATPGALPPGLAGVRAELERAGAAEALTLLDSAEARLRAGDWDGFGRQLGALRALLERQAGGTPPG